jgi:hypothetical protein
MCSVTRQTPPWARTARKPPQDPLGSILGPEEVATSAELINRLAVQGWSENNARQILARAARSAAYWRSEHLAFEAGGRVFARQSFWGSVPFREQLRAVVARERPRLSRLLDAIGNSTILRPAAEKLLCCPSVKREGHRFPLFEDEIKALIEAGFLKWEDVDTALARLTSFSFEGAVPSRDVARAKWAEQEVAATLGVILADYFRRTNLLTWGSLPSGKKSSLVLFNNYPFDHVAFSRMGPLLRFSKKATRPSPTPVVFEVLARECTENDVLSFQDRMARAGANKTSRMPMVGLVAAPNFQRAAWTKAKNDGLLCINLRQLFGSPALDVLVSVEKLMSRIGLSADLLKADAATDLAVKIEQSAASPIVKDLRSLGFEVLTGLILSSKGWSNLELNRSYPFKNPERPNDTRELDVGALRGGEEGYLVECKAHDPERPLGGAEVRRFFCETLPSFVSAKFGNTSPKKITAEIWTLGLVSSDTQDTFRSLKLPSYVEANLLNRAAIEDLVPVSLSGTRRLLATISLPVTAAY